MKKVWEGRSHAFPPVPAPLHPWISDKRLLFWNVRSLCTDARAQMLGRSIAQPVMVDLRAVDGWWWTIRRHADHQQPAHHCAAMRDQARCFESVSGLAHSLESVSGSAHSLFLLCEKAFLRVVSALSGPELSRQRDNFVLRGNCGFYPFKLTLWTNYARL